MKLIAVVILSFISVISLNAQDYIFRGNIDKDSLFNVFISKFPKRIQEDYIKTYKNGNEEDKDFFLFMISIPKNSKKELIDNYENKRKEISNLKEQYLKMVPKKYVVYIEFEPGSKILTVPDQITVKIYKIKNANDESGENYVVQMNDNLEIVSQNWDLKPNSKELEDALSVLGWTKQSLEDIKNLLKQANCISIENGKTTTVGFARSGMGKYSYKMFNAPLSAEQKENYNTGCEYIFYKENIVLEYGGGAIRPQCFERE